MNWQTLIAVGIVLATLVIFVIRLVLTKNKSGCGHDCSCGKPSEISPTNPPSA
jgi:FeoB-associated Cys-rich membrane protein